MIDYAETTLHESIMYDKLDLLDSFPYSFKMLFSQDFNLRIIKNVYVILYI